MIQQHFRLIDIRWTSLGLRAAASSGSRMMKRSLGIIFKIIVKIFIGSVCGPFENGWYLFLKIQEKPNLDRLVVEVEEYVRGFLWRRINKEERGGY